MTKINTHAKRTRARNAYKFRTYTYTRTQLIKIQQTGGKLINTFSLVYPIFSINNTCTPNHHASAPIVQLYDVRF